MAQVIFDFLNWLLNLIFNIIFTPIFDLLSGLFPGFDTILTALNYIFNTYIWKLMEFCVSFLHNALHIPEGIFYIIADTITAMITAYITIKAVKIFTSIYAKLHGNFNE